MTYANVGVSKQSSKDLGAMFLDMGAMGDESALIQKEYKLSVDQYLSSFTTQWANPITKFLSLKKEWEDNTAHWSSITEIVVHPAYQQIIGMGTIAIPLILEEMKSKPGHWFWALKAISGEDPVFPEHRGKIQQMTEDWLQWGKRKGYIK